MSENIITWNFTNWITVLIMAMLGFAALAFVAQLTHAAMGAASNSASQ